VSPAASRRLGFGLAVLLGLGTAWGAWRVLRRPEPGAFGEAHAPAARALLARLAAGLAEIQEIDGGFATWAEADRPSPPEPEVTRTASSALATWALGEAVALGADEDGTLLRARDRAVAYLLAAQGRDAAGGFGRMPLNPLQAPNRGPQVTATAAGVAALVTADPRRHAVAITKAARALGTEIRAGLWKGWMRASVAMAIDALLAAGRTGDLGPQPRTLLPKGEERDLPDCGDFRVGEAIVRVLRGEPERGDEYPERVLGACLEAEPPLWSGEATDVAAWFMQGWLAARSPRAPDWFSKVLEPLEEARGSGDLVPGGLYADRVAQTACAILVLAQGLRPQPLLLP
jgi:hypothetical protein